MGITLNNSVSPASGGSVNIILNKVTSYTQSNMNKFAVKSIPGATSPSIDSDTFVKSPRRYSIRAQVSAADKTILDTLAGEENIQCKLSDGVLTTVNVRPIDISFDNVPGNTDLPWIANIVLLAEDH